MRVENQNATHRPLNTKRGSIGLATLLLAVAYTVTPCDATRVLGFSMPGSSEFFGLGLSTTYNSSRLGGDRSLGLSLRGGPLSLAAGGFFTRADYRLDTERYSGSVGLDVYFIFVGLYSELLWLQDSTLDPGLDAGIGYGLKTFLPLPFPLFLHLGGKSYLASPVEFNVGLSLSLPLFGEPLDW